MANKDIAWLSLTYIWTTIDFTRLQREIAPEHLKESSGSSLLNEVPIDVDGARKEFGDL